MNKTNIIAVLLLLAAAGAAMADTGNNSGVTLDVNIQSVGCNETVAGVIIEVTVEVDGPNRTCDMDNLTVTANFTGDDVNETIALEMCDCDDNCTTMNYIGNVTIGEAGVNVTCEIVATDPDGECATDTYDFRMTNTIASIVIDGDYPGDSGSGCPGGFIVANSSCGSHYFDARCYTVCNVTEDCGNVNWSCSNEYVATIDATTGELVAHYAGVATVTATCGNDSDAVDIIVNAALSSCDGPGFNITGDENALVSGYTTLVVDLGTGTGSGYVQEIGDPASEPISGAVCGNIGDMVVKGAHVYVFDKDGNGTCNYTYTLTMYYNASNVAALGIDADTLTVLTCNGTSWVEVDGVDNEDGCVIADISGSGTYALVGTASVEDEEDDPAPAQQHSSGGGRDGTYPPEQFDSDDDSDVVDDVTVIPDEPDVVQPPVKTPDVVETPTTENTLDADIEHPDDDDGINTFWLFAGIVAIIAIGCAAVIKRRT